MTSESCYFRFAFIPLLFILLFLPESSSGTTVDRILATVDDHAITLADYRLFVKNVTGKHIEDDIDEKVLRQFIEEKMMAHEAVKRGITASDGEVESAIEEFRNQNNLSREELETLLKEDSLDLEKFRAMVRERILISRLVSKEVEARVLITDQEIEDFYKSNKRDFLETPAYVDLKAIFMLLKEGYSVTEITDMKRRALKIVAVLRGGADFERLADEYSDEPLKSHKGVLGRFTRGALIPPLDQTAFSMQEGQISDPVWVGDGVFILQLVTRSDETYAPLEKVKSSIYDILFKQKREKIFNEWIKALWEKSSVRIF